MNELTKVLSKSQVIDLFVKTKDSIMSGEQNPLKVAVHLKALEDVIKKLRTDDQIQSYILEEAEKEGSKTFILYGAEIQIKEMGTKYDYSECNDSQLIKLYNDMADLKKDIKKRETMLQNISDKNDIISEEGEILNPPVKRSKTGIAITLK